MPTGLLYTSGHPHSLSCHRHHLSSERNRIHYVKRREIDWSGQFTISVGVGCPYLVQKFAYSFLCSEVRWD